MEELEMKWEWKKEEKGFYQPKQEPRMIEVPSQNFIMIKGKGNPNEEDFSNRVSALYALSYAIKMLYKKEATKEIRDFTVYPLEGLWEKNNEGDLIKEQLTYTIMIRQPEFIDEDFVKKALEKVRVKKPNVLYQEIYFRTITDGLCVDLLHVGSYDTEPDSFQKMDHFLEEKGLKRAKTYHREIYLSNANRTKKEKLKTILRYSVK